MTARLAKVDWGAGQGLDLESEVPLALDEHPQREIAAQKFANPGKYLKNLRQLALDGKEEIKREKETAARPVVWGRDPDLIAPRESPSQELIEENSSASTSWRDVDKQDLLHVVPVTSLIDEEANSYIRLHDCDIATDEEGIHDADPADTGSTVTNPEEKYWKDPLLSASPGIRGCDATFPKVARDSGNNPPCLNSESTSIAAKQTITIANRIHNTFAEYHL